MTHIRRPAHRLAFSVAGVLTIGGCSTNRVTDPPRTATEQFLLSKAATDAVGQLSFETLRGRRVYVETEYFAASEQAFVLGELRARLLQSGVQLVRDADAAQIVLEVRSNGVGIDRNEFLLGIPSLQAGTIITAGAGGTPITTPELALLKNRYQVGVAGVSYVAYWRENGDIVAASGPFIGRSVRDDWWYFGAGPRSTGNIAPIDKVE